MAKWQTYADRPAVEDAIGRALNGAHIARYTYGIVYWEFFLISANGVENKLVASELRVPDASAWWRALKGGPIPLHAKEDAEHSICGLIAAHSTNSPVQSWKLDATCGLMLQFENGGSLYLPPVVDPNLGYSWRMDMVDKSSVICEAGDLYVRRTA